MFQSMKTPEGSNLLFLKMKQIFEYYSRVITLSIVISIAVTILTLMFINFDTPENAFYQKYSLKIKNMTKNIPETQKLTVEIILDKKTYKKFLYEPKVKAHEKDFENSERFLVSLNLFRDIAYGELDNAISRDWFFIGVKTRVFLLYIFMNILMFSMISKVMGKSIKEITDKINKITVESGAELITPEEYYKNFKSLGVAGVYISPIFEEVDDYSEDKIIEDKEWTTKKIKTKEQDNERH